MPTRTRMVVNLAGHVYAWPQLKKQVVAYCEAYTIPKPKDFTWKGLKKTMDALPVAPKGLYVYREPRRVRLARSRYKQIVQRYRLKKVIGRLPRVALGRIYEVPTWGPGAVAVDPGQVQQQTIRLTNPGTFTVTWGEGGLGATTTGNTNPGPDTGF